MSFNYDLPQSWETTATAEATAKAVAKEAGNTGLITEGKSLPEIVQGHEIHLAMIDAVDLIGRTYLADPNNEGTRSRMQIIELITLNKQDRANDPSMIRFKAVNSVETYEQNVEYNTILDHIEKEDRGGFRMAFFSIDVLKSPCLRWREKCNVILSWGLNPLRQKIKFG